MRISAKCRYGIAALFMLPPFDGNSLTSIFMVSEELNISKIYLEQVFGKLKHAGIITSVKGSAGGYKLAKDAALINLAEVVNALDDSIAESSYETVRERAPEIDAVITENLTSLDSVIQKTLSEISLESMKKQANDKKFGQAYMFYI
ncbi:MAG: Rrf2 family transcriptional regulator [Ruminococcus sp.]|jgi:Rrf2 family protein|nr:Rrf2 family transcriptional regulator [Ruminococcus sp.]